MKQNPFEIFISHASRDKELAGQLKGLFSEALGLDEKRIFRSSDGSSLKIGEAFDHQLLNAHQQAKAVVVVMTPNALLRHWVLCEMAAAHFNKKKKLFVMTANGLTHQCIPAPFGSLQIGDLGNESAVHNLCGQLGEALGRSINPLPVEKTRQIIKAASVGQNADWQRVKPMLVVEKKQMSPFRLEEILGDDSTIAAGMRIYLFAHDLSRAFAEFRNQDLLKAGIFRWLEQRPLRKFRVVISNQRPESERIRGLLEQWTREAPTASGSTFKARITNCVPQDAVFVDPTIEHGCHNGYAVLNPPGYGGKESDSSQIIVLRADGQVFDHYWKSYEHQMLNRKETTVI